MSEPLLIPCPACNGLNRIPAERLGDAALRPLQSRGAARQALCT